ncbi:MAG: glycosyltransferase family 2 protein [Dysgonamonadaceae bacterium]|jgi:glycosyltransferase involved in cell wall biosynthesis|nr:glycosyltransferase family 2 protein [Dysgonamonadaceae bacterium]
MNGKVKHKQLLVSVLMPAFNAEKYLREAMDSILAQTCADWELIAVNDCSTDRTKEIILSYSDVRIRYFENETNLGIAATRNRAIMEATGKYCAVMDADDISHPERLAKQVSFLRLHPDHVICGTLAKTFGVESRKMILPLQDEIIRCALLFQCTFIHSSVMIRTDALKQLKYGQFSQSEDLDLWVRIAVQRTGKMHNLNGQFIRYRVHEASASNTFNNIQRQMARKIHRRYLSESLDVNPSEEELDVHFMAVPVAKFADMPEARKRLPDLKKWMQTLWRANGRTRYFNRSHFAAYLWFRWLLACLFLKRYGEMPSLGIPVSPKTLSWILSMFMERIIIKLNR